MAATPTYLRPPIELSFEGNIAENWRIFKQQFQHFRIVSNLGERSQSVQAATFLCIAGLETQELLNNLEFTATESKENVDTLITKFEAYSNPSKNTTNERFIFNCVSQNGRNFDVLLNN